MSPSSLLLKPEPFVYCVTEEFWQRAAHLKATKWKLDVHQVAILGKYQAGRSTSGHTGWPARLFFEFHNEVTDHCEDEERKEEKYVPATMYIYETLVDLQQAKLSNSSALDTAELHVFMDLKHLKFHFRAIYYWRSDYEFTLLSTEHDPITKVIHALDPSGQSDSIGLPVWNMVCTLSSEELQQPLKLICHRMHNQVKELIVQVSRTENATLNSHDLSLIQVHTLSSLSDQDATNDLASQAALLNLQLMTWRFAPNLDLEAVRRCRFLILGCGTLGCNVLRTLVAWGARCFRLVDNGTVSLGNSARQSLINLEDAGQSKVEVVRHRLSQLVPMEDLDVQAEDLEIPMPGHLLTSSPNNLIVDRLNLLIQDSDVIFLLTDNRESRWLPTLLARCHNKVACTVALGFQDFLININFYGHHHTKAINGKGCYFCGDVHSLPGNSTIHKPLDLACTVSRPGLSQMAAGLAVELLMSRLFLGDSKDGGSGGGGDIQVRGFLSSMTSHEVEDELIRVQTFQQRASAECSACSDRMMEQYHGRGIPFIIECLQDMPEQYFQIFPSLSGDNNRDNDDDTAAKIETF